MACADDGRGRQASPLPSRQEAIPFSPREFPEFGYYENYQPLTGIPRSFRFMDGFGVHTFRLVNETGQSTCVKFHWKPRQDLQPVTCNEAAKINGADPDLHRRDLWDAIQRGEYPEWELCLQLFGDDFADEFGFDVPAERVTQVTCHRV